MVTHIEEGMTVGVFKNTVFREYYSLKEKR